MFWLQTIEYKIPFKQNKKQNTCNIIFTSDCHTKINILLILKVNFES